MNKLVRINLVNGLPSKCFKNDHTCVACLKGKKHKASCKTKLVNSVSNPLHTLHIDLFGPTSVSSLNHKWYCLVVTDNFSIFTWTFFIRTKDETSGILRNFITEIENLKDLKVKTISDAQDACNADAPESSGISNPTATSKIPLAEQIESLTVEYEFLTVISPVLIVFLDTSPETSSGSRLISKGVNSKKETPSLDNALTLSNRFEDTIRVEADLSNMEHKSKEIEEHSFIATIHQKTTLDLLQFCLFLCFLSKEEPNKIIDALKDPSWVEAMQEELLQFKIQNVWILVDCPKGIRSIGTKWVLKNKKDKRGIVIRNKARLVAQGHIEEEVLTMKKSLHQEFEALMHEKFQMSAMGELTLFLGLQVPQKKDDIFSLTKQGKDGPGKDVELYLYRSMIGSLMYLTASIPDIMFVVCACTRHQVTPKECHLYVVKRIFRYLKCHPKLELWYLKESPFDLVAYSDSDYGGATQDRKSTTGCCQFLGRRLISWQCKK
nr:hypothetical protein [Tanacetum cinerariifolium]GEX46591.1 hypothetical protein [Tanacetum cinerariifolium]GEX47699.1 hypothetical protein [Tanacetum cinerariifolium]